MSKIEHFGNMSPSEARQCLESEKTLREKTLTAKEYRELAEKTLASVPKIDLSFQVEGGVPVPKMHAEVNQYGNLELHQGSSIIEIPEPKVHQLGHWIAKTFT